MYDLTGDDTYKTAVEAFYNKVLSQGTTSGGMYWMDSSQWGSLRHSSNVAHALLQVCFRHCPDKIPSDKLPHLLKNITSKTTHLANMDLYYINLAFLALNLPTFTYYLFKAIVILIFSYFSTKFGFVLW